MTDSKQTMRCHYEVLELERTATTEEIKKQYKKFALKYHPDRNIGNEEQANAQFKEISNAYTVLSDSMERQWYDDHRDAILRGGSGTSDGSNEDQAVNLWKYFSSSCYSGDDNGQNGFFTVYRTVFEMIAQQEISKGSSSNSSNSNNNNNTTTSSSKSNLESVPSFGDETSTQRQFLNFYSHWENFVTTLSFAWEDRYNITDAPNRQVRRAMEKENAKARDQARREFINEVRALVQFVKKRDKRYIAFDKEIKLKKQLEEESRLLAKMQLEEDRRLRREQLKQEYQHDTAESEKRAEERTQAYLLADSDSDASDNGAEDNSDIDIDDLNREIDAFYNRKLSSSEAAAFNALTEEEKLQQYLESVRLQAKSVKTDVANVIASGIGQGNEQNTNVSVDTGRNSKKGKKKTIPIKQLSTTTTTSSSSAAPTSVFEQTEAMIANNNNNNSFVSDSDVNKSTSDEQTAQEFEKTNDTDPFHCDICSKSFASETQLQQHENSKVHRKKATEMKRSTGKKSGKLT